VGGGGGKWNFVCTFFITKFIDLFVFLFYFSYYDDHDYIDESNSDGTDTVNGTNTQYSHSQILGDHHTNSSNSSSAKTSTSHTYKLRNYNNNKENYYNQRPKFGGAAPQQQKSWQRGGFRAPVVNGKDKRTDLNGNYNNNNTIPASVSTDGKIEPATEPIKFNEGEYFTHASQFRTILEQRFFFVFNLFFLVQLTPTCEIRCAINF
jgi:hypothetical protein